MGSIPTFGIMDFGVRLAVVDGMEAEVICGLLRSAGIRCNHRQTDLGVGAFEALANAGPREVLVSAHDIDAARELIRHARSDDS